MKKLNGSEAAENFIEYADRISNSEIIPPLIRYEESMRLYGEALTQVEDDEIKKRFENLKAIYNVGNLDLSKVTAEVRRIEEQERKIKELEDELKYQKALSKFKEQIKNQNIRSGNTYIDTRCRTCGGDGSINCVLHDTNNDGYCTNCNDSGFEVCYHCLGSGRQ